MDTLSRDQQEALSKAVLLLEEFRKLDHDMPIQHALSFLYIARNEGMSLRELSDRIGLAQSSTSRNVAALSKWHSFKKAGHDLVEAQVDPMERRKKTLVLTAKGRRVLAAVMNALSVNAY